MLINLPPGTHVVLQCLILVIDLSVVPVTLPIFSRRITASLWYRFAPLLEFAISMHYLFITSVRLHFFSCGSVTRRSHVSSSLTLEWLDGHALTFMLHPRLWLTGGILGPRSEL